LLNSGSQLAGLYRKIYTENLQQEQEQKEIQNATVKTNTANARVGLNCQKTRQSGQSNSAKAACCGGIPI